MRLASKLIGTTGCRSCRYVPILSSSTRWCDRRTARCSIALCRRGRTDVGTPPTSTLGDCIGDGSLRVADLDYVATIDERDAVLNALSGLPGDLDGDAVIGFADFLVLSGNFGKEGQSYPKA